MTEQIEKAVWDRAKRLFEAEGRKDRVWGTVSKDGTQVYAFTERASPDSPTIIPLDADERRPYIERAKAELADEQGND